MKTFNNFEDAFDWANKVVKKTNKEYLFAVTNQIYKDSNEFTYRLDGTMYQSGNLYSDFENGIIVERTPYVRRRYYEGGKAGANNRKGQAHWFEKTVQTFKKDYISMYNKTLNGAKK